jgi:antitoxin (DNA-binding transcriptional repressor) of toxin-antitoxin stability system
MRYFNIREMRSLLGKLDELVEEQQELIITRNKKEIARVLPVRTKRKRPTHAQLRQLTQPSEISSTAMIRQDRDER